jgi:hypothetical protein
MIARNPGVTAIWVTKSYEIMRVGNGIVISMGDPIRMEFWTKGRRATRAEVDESVRDGFPALLKVADREGPDGVKELLRARRAFDHRLALADVV